MKCEYIAVHSFYLLVTIFGTANGDINDQIMTAGRRNKNECYRAEFAEDVAPCADFENEIMKCSTLELGLVDGTDGDLGLQGSIDIDSDIEDGTQMNVEIWKIMDIGREYLYHTQGDICSSLDEKSTPWYSLIQALKIYECPIAKKNYEVNDMIIDLEHAKDMLTHEMCGEYIVQLSMTKELDKLSCHELAITVSEYSCNKTED